MAKIRNKNLFLIHLSQILVKSVFTEWQSEDRHGPVTSPRPNSDIGLTRNTASMPAPHWLRALARQTPSIPTRTKQSLSDSLLFLFKLVQQE